jgi:hypothetical protein
MHQGGHEMPGFSRGKSLSLFLLVILLLFVLATGCRQKATTQVTSFSGQTSTTAETSPATTGQTDVSSVQTSSPETEATTTGSGSDTTTEESSEDSLTSAAPAIDYRVLAANQIHMVDLNDDGQKESITYNSPDDFSFNLTLNGETIRQDGEMFLPGWFFLIDLDSGDHFLDIAIQELGASDDYQVTFFYYNGSHLVLRGIVPGMICDAFSATIDKDPYGLGTIRVDGDGGLIALARGNVLHTWFFDEPWQIGENQLLHKIPQSYYPMQSYDLESGNRLPETPVKMKMDLPIVAWPGSSEVAAIARSGQDASLVQTDNQEWVQLRTQNGVLGWFRLKDYFMVMIGSQVYFSDDVFRGLSFAD